MSAPKALVEKCEAPGAGKVDTIAVVRGTDISDVEARSEAKLYVPTRTAYISPSALDLSATTRDTRAYTPIALLGRTSESQS